MTIISLFLALLSIVAVAQDANLMLALEKDKPAIIELPMTHIKVTATADELIAEFVCEEPNMEYIRKKYATSQWNVFGGENVEMFLSPFGGSPNYRFLINPSKNMVQAFMGDAKWRNPSITGDAKKEDSSWTATFVIPYSALEDDDIRPKAPATRRPLRQGKSWKANFSRTRRASGKTEHFVWDKEADLGAKGKGRIIIPDDVFAAFPTVAIKALAVSEPDDDGKALCTGTIIDTANGFSGEAQYMLFIDGKSSCIHKMPVALKPGESSPFSVPIELPEHSGKFKLTLHLLDANGKIVRSSREIPITNPWME